jgi:hypothetical protein
MIKGLSWYAEQPVSHVSHDAGHPHMKSESFKFEILPFITRFSAVS